VTTTVVEYEPDFAETSVLEQFPQEALEGEPVGVRKDQHEAGSVHRLNRGIEPELVVLVLMNPGRADAERAAQPAMRDFQAKLGMVEDPLQREPVHQGCQLIFERRLLGRAGGLTVAWPSGLQLGLAPAEQLGQGVDAVGDVPGVAKVGGGLVQSADAAGPHLGLEPRSGLRRDALHHAAGRSATTRAAAWTMPGAHSP
jgi:hypothetical protein